MVGGPLIVVTVIVHVLGLGVTRAIFRPKAGIGHGGRVLRHPTLHFMVVMSLTVSLVTLLHLLQAWIWSTTLVFVGAMNDPRHAMLYALSAMTTYGHAAVYLDVRWQMLGAIVALDGVILTGLTTAFLYAVIRQEWENRQHV